MPRTRRSVPIDFLSASNLETPPQVDSACVTTGSLDFEYALFAPRHYAPGYAYPLIVWLHGAGDLERQLQWIMPLVSMQNYVAVAPRGLRLDEAGASETVRYGWRQESDAVERAEHRVFDALALAQRKYHIAERRIFLAGFGAGGTMALRLAMDHPRRFAGVVSLCGAFPAGDKLFGNLLAARQLGMFLATGRTSQRYPAQQVCEDLRLLHTAGLSITLRQYPCGDELPPQMLADVNRWIMGQIAPASAAELESNVQWLYEAD